VSQTLDLVNDYSRFVTGFFEVIRTSAPHIYHSALPVCPRESLVRGLYEPYVRPLTRIVRGLPTSWDSSVATMRFRDRVYAAAWSPCSRSVAISWGECPPTVEILDAATLLRLTILELPTGGLGFTRQLVFFPDGRLLTWLGFDGTGYWGKLISWDLQTGVLVSAITTENALVTGRSSITYSACGMMIGVLYLPFSAPDATIETYNTLSGTRICSCPVVEGLVPGEIWTHGECLRFTTITPGSITIWEARFASTHAPMVVETLSIPDGPHTPSKVLVPPTLPQLAGCARARDTQDYRFLLESEYAISNGGLSFSPDGRFFAYDGINPEGEGGCIDLWKESHTGYDLHQKFISNFRNIKPRISPNGRTVIALGESVIQLWHIMDSTTSLSTVPARATQNNGKIFVLGFSPDEALAAVMRGGGETITVVDLKSGIPQLIIDTDMKVYWLGVTGSSIVAVEDGKIVTCNLPAGDRIPNLRVDITDSVRTATFFHDFRVPNGLSGSLSAISVSPDLHHIAVVDTYYNTYNDTLECFYLRLYDVPTGQHLATVTADQDSSSFPPTLWFTPDGCEVWYMGAHDQAYGWKIVEGSESDVTELEYLGSTMHKPDGSPWKSSRGYQVTDDQWILSPSGKRLFWLPPQWRSYEWPGRWGGRFLALSHSELPEAVILELE